MIGDCAKPLIRLECACDHDGATDRRYWIATIAAEDVTILYEDPSAGGNAVDDGGEGARREVVKDGGGATTGSAAAGGSAAARGARGGRRRASRRRASRRRGDDDANADADERDGELGSDQGSLRLAPFEEVKVMAGPTTSPLRTQCRRATPRRRLIIFAVQV